MREYWIEFHGYCKVKADDKNSAEHQFYEEIMPQSNDCMYKADRIEMIEPFTIQLSMFNEE